MKRFFSPRGWVSESASNALAWPHLQRLAERWLRRWGFALTGLALGLSGMWLTRPEVSEAHASAVQAVASLTQQLAGMPSEAALQTPAKGATPSQPSASDAQRLLSGLPAWSQPEQVWALWQQALAAHGLRLQSLQPMPPTAPEGRGAALLSHAAAWQVVGRFDDWAMLWAACAESGPVCALERIQIVATDQPSEVQIDAVMRVWMRPDEKRAVDVADVADQGAASLSGGDVRSLWMADVRTGVQPSGRSRVALFAPKQSAAAGAALANSGLTGGATPSTNAEPAAVASAPVTSLAVLPDDPHQWPYARVRLTGLWQQGDERQAVLSAGTHTLRVVPGQRVTLEGHQVVAITDAGVHLRLGKGPVLQLAWANEPQVAATASQSVGLTVGLSVGPTVGQSAGQFTGQSTGPSTAASTIGNQEK